ncbi:MAG: (E)-4-hydroxy-3-methylbut-2-enyl-diphosphate synthase [Bacteroidota bacterium]|nr:(E)-4-hydroxy-3-methylbut-2-enyl-diphosphate synthase [Bacteroidota bacterium]
MRRKTNTVTIGNTPMGSEYPVRIQSMTTTDTMDTEKTVEQSIRMIESGCEYIRITAPSMNEAQNLQNIKDELRKRGYNTPLVADIHFTPNAAEIAARIVEKVRINPGNFADKKKFETIDYNDAEYEAELERIKERFTPLVHICKEQGTAMRIGTNHGSLSDRIMSRYGDTPLGMVESALEFLRICRAEDYHNIVLSMKSSNPQVMVQAYRLLVQRMDLENMHYPLHIGVTEAGDGDDGRIKSAIGIGTLLEEGLGDTVRVSLTEDPEFEAPVAKFLVERYDNDSPDELIIEDFSDSLKVKEHYSPFSYQKRKSVEVENIGGTQLPRVVVDLSYLKNITEFDLQLVGHQYDAALDKWHMTEQGCDYIFAGDHPVNFMLPNGLKAIYNYKTWEKLSNREQSFPLIEIGNTKTDITWHSKLNFVYINDLAQISKLQHIPANAILILECIHPRPMRVLRQMLWGLMYYSIKNPAILKASYTEPKEKTILYSSTDIGGLMIDGMGDGIWLQCSAVPLNEVNSISFGILQAARLRISKTEYISCPSCGRTLFDLQETTAMIRSKTEHLKGLKIAIMGCIVNGPGEMADADYGYVGSGPGKITLYKSRDIMKRNISSENAVDELIQLITDNGDWLEVS